MLEILPANEHGAANSPGAEHTPTPEQLFQDYAPRVYQVCRRLLSNDADAQDVSQEVFLQVIRKLPGFRGDAALPTWLHRVAVNMALAYRRKQAVHDGHCVHGEPSVLDGGPVPRHHVVPEPEKRALELEMHQIIEEAMLTLPGKYRDVYALADVQEMPCTEVAQRLGLSLAAVKSRLHRARALMRQALDGYGDAP